MGSETPPPPPPPQGRAAAPFLAVETSDEPILWLKESGKTFSRDVASARIFDLESDFLGARAEWFDGKTPAASALPTVFAASTDDEAPKDDGCCCCSMCQGWVS